MLLSKAKIKRNYKIINIFCEDKTRRRLFELGFTSGQVVKVEKKSLFSGVFLLSLRNYVIAIKREQLKYIEVADA